MVDIRDIYSLTEFQRNTKDCIEHLQQTHKPVVLTVNGRATVVVQDAESYQAMLDELELARSVLSIVESMEEFKKGNDTEVKSALEKLRAKLGISH